MTGIFEGRDQPVRPHGRSSSATPAPVGATAVLDQHLRFTGWSREAEVLFGLASEEVLGRSAVVTAARCPCPCLSPRSSWGRVRPGGC